MFGFNNPRIKKAIMDEVITGLRFRPGSAQMYHGVQPDLSIFAKAIANGFSLSLIGGKKEVMQMFNPMGLVTCSGTGTGNLMFVMVATECIKMALEPVFFDGLEPTEKHLADGITDLFQKYSITGHIRMHRAQGGISSDMMILPLITILEISCLDSAVNLAEHLLLERWKKNFISTITEMHLHRIISDSA